MQTKYIYMSVRIHFINTSIVSTDFELDPETEMCGLELGVDTLRLRLAVLDWIIVSFSFLACTTRSV